MVKNDNSYSFQTGLFDKMYEDRKEENKKKYGLVIDLKAKSTIEICNRVQHYLKLENIFHQNVCNAKRLGIENFKSIIWENHG